MAKVGKSKKSTKTKEKEKVKKTVKKKTLETKTKTKTKKTVKKEPIIGKEIVENTEEKKPIEEKKPKKEIKGKKDKTSKSKKLSKKVRNKIIRLAIITVILSVSLVLLFNENKRSYINNISFVTKNNITTKDLYSKFKAPIYSFAIDKKENPIEVEGLSFVDEDITYTFHDATREELEDGNVLISIPCDMDVELEYVVSDDVDTNWTYTYSYAPVFAFDYYSGDIYRENTISDSKLVLLGGEQEKTSSKNKKKSKEKEEDKMAYTEQVYGGKKFSIGVLNNSTKSTWRSALYQGNEDDGKHFIVSNSSTTIIYIKAPKEYDGMMLAINKNGSSYETWKKEYDTYTKLLSLKDEAKKTGEKSKELEKIEKEQLMVHKLLDQEDELRKEYSKDDFYIIRIADVFKDNYTIKVEENINLLYITGILVLSLAIPTCIFMMIGERNKAHGKRGY